MKKRMVIAAVLACVCETVAWGVQFHYGIGSCGPASNTPFLCLVFAMGPFNTLTDIPVSARALDAVPDPIALGVMFLLPAIIWSGVFFTLLSAGHMLWNSALKSRYGRAANNALHGSVTSGEPADRTDDRDASNSSALSRKGTSHGT